MKELRSFISFSGYYRMFIKDYSQLGKQQDIHPFAIKEREVQTYSITTQRHLLDLDER